MSEALAKKVEVIDLEKLSGSTQEYLNMKNEVLGSVYGNVDNLFLTEGEDSFLSEKFKSGKDYWR